MKSTFLKILIFALPFLALIFIYIKFETHKQHVIIKKTDTHFSRSWNEFDYQFTGRKKYARRANLYEKKIIAERKKEREERNNRLKRTTKLMQSLNNSMEGLK